MVKKSNQSNEANQEVEQDTVVRKNLVERIVGLRTGHWWALFYSGLLVFIIFAIWAVGSWQFKQVRVGTKYLSTANLNSNFAKTLNQEVDKYRITIDGMSDKPQSYTIADAGMKIDNDASLKATKKDDLSWNSRLLWWKKKPAILVLKNDNAKQIDFVNKHARLISKEVKNANIVLSPEGKVDVTPESNGEEKSLGNGQIILNLAVQNMDSKPLKLEPRTVKPTITLKSIKTTQDKLEALLKKEISFNVQSNNIVAEPTDIASWLVLTPNELKHTYDTTVDSARVTDFINRKTSQYIRQPVNQVEVVRPDGSKIVVVKGINGQDVTNKDETIKSIQDQLFTKDKINLDLTIAYTDFKTTQTDAGNKLIEVDLTNKILYAYENNVLIKTILISAGAPATPTVTGTYTIYSKIRAQDMRGFNADGSTYFQPNVEFVNYFYGGYAIHGNYWRPATWFGNINSSHGCVGMPNSEAEWVYDWAPIGTPIVTHW